MKSAGIIIVGAGHAAVRAALSIRDAGYDGTLTMVAEDGVDAPHERPPLSKWASGESVLAKPIVPDEHLASARVERLSAKVVAVDPGAMEVTLENGTALPFRKLLLATGATARRLDEKTTGGVPVRYLRSLEDATALRQAAGSARSVILIGGGFIGLELAASLRGLGLSVHVIEMADRLLARAVTAPVAKIVQTLHEDQGVEFTLGTGVTSFKRPATVVLGDGREVSADFIIAGIGSVANTALAQEAGLTVANGITVDTHMRTSDPDIFAAGDCCHFPLYGAGGSMTRLESWQAAGEQGALAGRNMVTDTESSLESYTHTPWFWSEQYGHVLQVSGLPGEETERVERSYARDHHVSFGLNAQNGLAFACGIAPGTKVAKDIRFAAKLIEGDILVDRTKLGDPSITLKSILRT